MAVKREVELFLSLLSSQLAETSDCLKIIENDDLLRELIEDGLSALPTCPVKTYVEKNIINCQEKLKSLLIETSGIRPAVASSVSHDCSYICSAATHDSVEKTLKSIKEYNHNENDIFSMYCSLSFSCLSNKGIGLRTVLMHWAQTLVTESSADKLIPVIKYCSQCLLKEHTLFECLEFITFLLSNTTSLPSLTEFLLSLLFSVRFHYSTFSCKNDSIARNYGNHISALLSFYIEFYLTDINECDTMKMTTHLIKVLKTLSDNNELIIMSTLLQTQPPNEDSQTVLALVIKSILTSCSSSKDPLVYVSALCCLNNFKRFTISKVHELSNINLSPPSDKTCQWLWDNCPNTCKQLKLKKSWSCDRIHDYLTSNLTKEQEELLLKLITNGGVEETFNIPTTISTGQEMLNVSPFGDHSRSSDIMEDEREEDKEEENNLKERDSPMFYLDKSGLMSEDIDKEKQNELEEENMEDQGSEEEEPEEFGGVRSNFIDDITAKGSEGEEEIGEKRSNLVENFTSKEEEEMKEEMEEEKGNEGEEHDKNNPMMISDNNIVTEVLPSVAMMDTSLLCTTSTLKANSKEEYINKDPCNVVMEMPIATPTTVKRMSSKRKSLLKKLRNSLTPPTSRVTKFSPRLLRSAVKKKAAAEKKL